ncbi:MAG: redoxin domain-containing protein [Bacteroidetes bacterium]|jgi:peroxiredoxin|nr:redoxin domain-containing protein [Bacteroidota bacterium]
MKKLLFLLTLISLVIATGNAQLPENAEDISPLLYGESVPDVKLTAADGSKHSLKNLISQQPSILLFYRGGWCPYCNTQLAEMQQVEQEIMYLGYKILAISPDNVENLKQSVDKHDLTYELYSDADGSLTKALGIAFKAPGRYTRMLSKRSNEHNEGFLPVPAVFVVDTEGTITFEYINPDYKTRLSADLLLAVLKALKKE